MTIRLSIQWRPNVHQSNKRCQMNEVPPQFRRSLRVLHQETHQMRCPKHDTLQAEEATLDDMGPKVEGHNQNGLPSTAYGTGS